MKAKGRITLPLIEFLDSTSIEIDPTLKKWLHDSKKLSFTITGDAHLTPTDNPKVYLLTSDIDSCDIMLETWYQKRTLKQNNTLKAIESIIYQLDYKRKPTNHDVDFIHQGILEMANIRIENTWTKKMVLVTSSMKECTTAHMDRFIEIALEELSLRNISDDMRDAFFDRPISEIFRTWYKRRVVLDDLHSITWKEYKVKFPYCEFTFKANSSANKLERMHIISAGANPAIYEESWNWIHASAHIHRIQHQHGWDAVIQDYPHIIPKLEKAKEMERKYNETQNLSQKEED